MRRGVVLLLLAAGCSSNDAPAAASLVLSTGKESDALTRTPVPTRLVVRAKTQGNAAQTLADVGWPIDTLALGDLASGTSYAFSVELTDATGKALLRGESPPVLSDDVSGASLTMLVGRTGELARPTSGLASAWSTPLAAPVAGRYAFVAGDAENSELYDFVGLAPLEQSAKLPRAPRSVAPLGSSAVLLVDDQGASSYDLSSGASSDVQLGVAAADLAGGATLIGADGRAYVVGGTRDGSPTSAVLRIASDGTTTALALAIPRARAAAAWCPQTGLVVVGGGGDAEVLPPDGTTFASVATGLPDATGAAAAGARAGELVVFGGVSGGAYRVRVAAGGATSLGGDWTHVAGVASFPVADGIALAVARADDATTHVFVVRDDGSSTSIDETPLHVPRTNAAAVPLGDGYVAILGGLDATGAPAGDVEIFTPP